MGGSEYGWLWEWDKGFKILPVHIHSWGRSAKLCVELAYRGKGLSSPDAKSWEAQTQIPKKKEFKINICSESQRAKVGLILFEFLVHVPI